MSCNRLQSLIAQGDLQPFALGRVPQHISHLAFADDLLILLNRATHNLQRFRGFLEQYQRAYGQIVSYRKSHFVPASIVLRTQLHSKECDLNMTSAHLPLKYLGVNLVNGRMKSSYCLQLISQFDARLNRWHNRLLSLAGRLILIRHVFECYPSALYCG